YFVWKFHVLVPIPRSCEDLDVIAHAIAKRVSRFLEKAGYLVRDAKFQYLDLIQDEDDAMGAIVGASITYRLAFGPNAGRKALTLQTVPVRTDQQTTLF
ncbi:MAG: IS91 family transposase, partial [bacterium]